ncbi:undecaprenyl-phosphate glucose phosphotransferase [Lichenicoccus roseus]|uniref:Undecaprenyl-phosphate glucose phosphotransferase n=1 Tax=Lichenicoccus roseus TaxID=2683649 RepID=A0A5R9JBJ6_9PROT|nr:undecaprenyl-phosphate glucose phosphotransferase [Lichenicoccus roseus]TLU74123.1 undecaprenyl-phosphate glucose phosphotransferase [Lichenicoccus roseus]
MLAIPEPAPPRAHTISFPVMAGLVRITDLILLIVAGYLSIRIETDLYGSYPKGAIEPAAWAGALAASFSLARASAYSQSVLMSGPVQLRRLVRPLAFGAFCQIACLFVLYHGNLPFRSWPFVWGLVAACALGLSRLPLIRLLGRWSRDGRLARKVAIVGAGEHSRVFMERLREEPGAYQVVGLYDDRMSRLPDVPLDVPLRGTVADLVQQSREEPVDVIVVALPLNAAERIKSIMEQLSSTVADIVLTTDLPRLGFDYTQFEVVGRNPVVAVREAPLKDWQAIEKAVLDRSIGLLALVLLSPLLLATVIAIKLDSPGPVLFRQPRMGFNNRPFICYKFRSMHSAMTDLLADRQTTRDDPRITRVGRVIRKLSIDELPQIFNVLNGTMSLVGPRPHAPNTKAADRLFTEVVQQYALRHRVKPGITGWAQVNGWRGETKTIDQIEQRVACDLFYIENWSVRFDIEIMIRTLLGEVRSKTAF